MRGQQAWSGCGARGTRRRGGEKEGKEAEGGAGEGQAPGGRRHRLLPLGAEVLAPNNTPLHRAMDALQPVLVFLGMAKGKEEKEVFSFCDKGCD